MPDGSGSVRSHLEQYEKGTGEKHPDLANEPECPPGAAHIFGWFEELNSSRQFNMGTPQPFTFTELEAWARVSRMRPSEFEVKAIRILDTLWRVAFAENQKKG